MPPFSSRLLMIFLLAAAFLNFTNYAVIRFYDPPIPLKRLYTKHMHNNSMRYTRLTIDSKSWALKLICGVNSSAKNPNCRRNQHTVPMTYFTDNIYDPGKTDNIMCPEMPHGLGVSRRLSRNLLKTTPYGQNSSLMKVLIVGTRTTNELNAILLCEFSFSTLRVYMVFLVALCPITEERPSDTMEAFVSSYSEIKPGGIFNTSACKARHSVAIIIAFRGLKSSLASFLYFLHPFLIKQQLDYQIFVVEQSNITQTFNRGKLLNVGFTEAQKRSPDWDCFVFHEPNIVPMDSRNLYRCSWYPKQLALVVNRPFKMPYQLRFGGAVAMTSEQIFKVNGFSNLYWGNDADYDDLYNRLIVSSYLVEHTIRITGRYRTLKNINTPTRLRSQMKQTVSPLFLLDGLTSLTYTVNKFELRPFYTHIKVNIDDTIETPIDSTTQVTQTDIKNATFVQKTNVTK